MAKEIDTKQPFRLGVFDVEPLNNTIQKDDKKIPLEPRVMDVLCTLAASNGDVTSRETLIAEVWNVEYAANESVTRVISALRKTFRDAGETDAYIETVSKRGYRLVQPVEYKVSVPQVKPEILGTAAAQDTHNQKRKSLILISLIVAAMLVAMAWAFFPSHDDDATPSPYTLAVLPFTSMSLDDSDELFADGLSEELLNTLANIDGLKIASRTSSFVYKNKSVSMRDIGKNLNVDYVLEGSIRRSGDRMRITAQLISIEDGYHIWSETYDRILNDIFVVQDDIARHVARALNSKLVGDDDSMLFDVGTTNAEAFKYYLEGRKYLNRRGLGLSRAITNFEKAIEADPEYARAFAGLATSHVVSHIYLNVPKEIARKRAQNFAKTATRLNPALAEPYAVLGVIEADQNNWQKAIDYYNEGERLEPNNVVVLQWYAELLTHIGFLEQAKARITQAIEVDPGSAILNLVAGNIAYCQDDLESTEFYYKQAKNLGLSDGIIGSAFIEFRRQNFERSAQMMAIGSFNDQVIADDEVDGLTDFLIKIMRGEEKVDDEINAFPTLKLDDDFLAEVYLLSGESEKALKVIESDPDGDHDSFYLLWTNTDPNLRKVPYFKTFAQNVGLLEFWTLNGWPDKCPAVKDNSQITLDCF